MTDINYFGMLNMKKSLGTAKIFFCLHIICYLPVIINSEATKKIPDSNKLAFSVLESKLYSPELRKCYFLQIHKQIFFKVPISYLNGPKHPPDNFCVTCLLREESALQLEF
jgi:hypothetical protein